MITMPEWHNASVIVDSNLEAEREDNVAISGSAVPQEEAEAEAEASRAVEP